FVLELGEYHTAELTRSPHIALLTNLYHEHLDYFGTIEKYQAAMRNLPSFQSSRDYFVYNAAVPEFTQWAPTLPSQKIAYNAHEMLDISKSKLIGEHNRLNAIAARTVARLLRVEEAAIQQAIDTFQPIRHRLQIVA